MVSRLKPVFLIKEVEDRHAQENWWKLKQYLDDLGVSDSTTITNIIQANGLSPWQKITKVVPASTNFTADTIALNNFTCIDYHVCMKKVGGPETKTFNFKVRKADTDVADQLYGIEGDALDVDISATVVGSNMDLKFNNSEAFDVSLVFTKLVM